MSTQLLARFRVALGWTVAPLVLIVADPSRSTIAAGLLIAIAGEALRIWAAGHLNKSREVTSSGPYQWFAHPLYVGSSIMGLGLGIASRSVIVIGIIALYLVLTLRAAIASEEAYLRRTFGDQYEMYRQGVRERARSTSERTRPFSFERALANREHRAVVGLLAAFLLLILKATYNGTL